MTYSINCQDDSGDLVFDRVAQNVSQNGNHIESAGND